MSVLLDISPSYWETVVRDERIVVSLSLVGFTALLYDHLLTFELEVGLIWNASSLGFVSVVFLLNRYIAPLMLAVDMYELSGYAPNSVIFCQIWTGMQSYLTIASFMSIHAVMAIRVYALYNGARWIRNFLWVSGTLYLLLSTAVVTYIHIPVLRDIFPFQGYCVSIPPWYLWTAWLPTVVFESILFMVTLIALLQYGGRQSLSTLMLILYRDGMLYFVAVTFCSTFSLLVWALADPILSGLGRYFPLAVVNIVSSRMILNLKQFAALRRRAIDGNPTSGHLYPSFGIVSMPTPPAPVMRRTRPRDPEPVRSTSPYSAFDLELYTIEREYQQLGSKLR